MMKLNVLWLLFDEIDLTIRFRRVEIDWVSYLQVGNSSGWPPRFACQNTGYVKNWHVLPDLRLANRHCLLTQFVALIATVISVCADSIPRVASICVPILPCESTRSPGKPSLRLSSEDSHRTRFDETNPAVTSVSQDSAPVKKSMVWPLLHVYRGRGSVIKFCHFIY